MPVSILGEHIEVVRPTLVRPPQKAKSWSPRQRYRTRKARSVKEEVMEKTIEVRLERKAKKKGGDRYENKELGFTIYIPQWISRTNGSAPKEKLEVTFSN